ncbi:hypothetical protein J4573_40595 [Actinomadura barringtoniae]|uniref:Uncharacterized protein n=1 Tax=Actinomadura barringtoniae TaxID=1427535 RepID=A0A939PNZ7_9ACTN|nr:hypothetical protein [Actinomadura barringtoniae]MBO2453449.1 hypothetical protein [Actinomadura barringtoniae]
MAIEADRRASCAGLDGSRVGITWEEAYLDGLQAAVKDGSVPMEGLASR